MENLALHELLGQSCRAEVATVFERYVRGSVLLMLVTAMEEEVTALCGAPYAPSSATFERGGSAPGKMHVGSETVPVARPRVRRKAAGPGREVPLETYAAGRDGGTLREALMRALAAGVSSRDQGPLYPAAAGTSRSQVSREWVEYGERFVSALRSRSLAAEDFVVLMLDGVVLSADQVAIVALGITADGRKMMLDMQLGASENEEVCADLLRRLVERGFAPRRRLLAILDGAPALSKCVRRQWSDCLVQRCLVHKERNIRAYLSKRHHGELGRLFQRLRQSQGLRQALEVHGQLRAFLKRVNAQALTSLEEAGEELLAVFMLELPNTLHLSLLSTNCIENPFRNVRARLGRVKRWRKTTMAERWLAYGLLTAEKGFRSIAHYRELPHLVRALEQPAETLEAAKKKIAAVLDKELDTTK